MDSSKLRLERINPNHVVAAFCCGKPKLDTWLHKAALTSDRMDSARVVLLFEDAELIGYYALTMGSVPRDEAPKSLVRGGPSEIGVVVLAKLAVSQDRQGQGLGAYLVARALQAAASAGALAAARLVVVDAFDDEVIPFYTRWGFRNLPENPLRLYARLSDIVMTLSDVGPSVGLSAG